MKQGIQKQSHPGAQYMAMSQSMPGGQHHLSKSQYMLPTNATTAAGGQLPSHPQSAITYAHTSQQNQMIGVGGSGSQNTGLTGQNGRSASSGTNQNNKASKSQIQPVFAMKNRKVKNASYSSQQRTTDRIDKVQQNFGSQSGGLQAQQNFHGSSQINQNMGISNSLAQFEGATSSLTMAANQQMHQPAIQLQPQLQQQMKNQYNSTQPAVGGYTGSGFGLNQGYQGIKNAQMKNQKNYQAKVQKARRLGSSSGMGSQQNQNTQMKHQQVAGQNSQGMQNSQNQLANMPAMFHQTYKNNIVTSTNTGGQQTVMISSSNPPSAGGNSRSKSVHQQAHSATNVYGLVASHQQQSNNNLASTNAQSQSQQSSGLEPPSHTSTKSHHFTSSNPIAIDPYSQQSPQIGGLNFAQQQQSMNSNQGTKPYPKTAKQQRSLSDHFGGTRRQAQGVTVKSMDQQQQPSSVNQKKGSKQQQSLSQTNKANIPAVNQSHHSQLQFQQRMNQSQSQFDNSAMHGNIQMISGGQKQMHMNTQKLSNSQKHQKDTVGSHKMINLNSKLSGIYKQYKTASGTGQAHQPNHGQVDNMLSPKDFGYLTQTQLGQKNSQTQKQMSQSGQIHYNIGQHTMIHDGGRNVQNRLMSYQPGSQGQNSNLKSIDAIQKNQIRDRSPNSTALGAPGSQSQIQNRSTDYQTQKSHNLKSQSMHQIPVQQQQNQQQNKYSVFDQQVNPDNYSGANNDLNYSDNVMKRQQVGKLTQAHSVAVLNSTDQQPHASGRLPSDKRSDKNGGDQARANQNQVSQKQGTPSMKHRRMSPQITGVENNTQIDQIILNSRSAIASNSQIQSIRTGNSQFQNTMSAANLGSFNTQPSNSSYHNISQDSKAPVSAAPASGVNSNLAQFGASHLLNRTGTVNSYLDSKSNFGIKAESSNPLSQSIKQIPIRKVNVRNQTGSFVEPSRTFNLSLKESQQPIGKIDKNPDTATQHQRVQSHQNGNEAKQDLKILNESQIKQGFHQRKEARVPSAGKKRTPSGQANKRIPSGQRLKQPINPEQIKPAPITKQIITEDKKKDQGENIITEEQTGNLLKPRSSITNIRRSRNEGKTNLPDASNSDMLDAAGNPTSAGQSTSSLYKQEQINKRFKFQETSAREAALNTQPQKERVKSQDLTKSNKDKIEIEEQGKSKYDLTKSITPSNATNKNKGKNDQSADNQDKPDTINEKKDEKDSGTVNTAQDRKALFAVAPNAGLSGRNLYFNQIRSEINLSESGKCKSLPDYQNAKYSNKRNGLVAGYGANTNQGIVRNYNEDRVAIILNIMKPKSKNYESQAWPKCSFFGIYDGHGGAVCADFLRDYLHQFIIKDENFPQNPIQALRNGFREAERLFMEFAESQEKEAGEIDRSGSCAVVILIIDDMCYCANTGDSRAIMSADGGEKLFLLSTDHKPTDEIEMKRIIEQGGRIYQNSQVIQTNPSLGEVGKQMVYGPHRVFPGRLSVSRTIGDIEAKVEKYEGNANVVIADPDVTAFEIKDNHDFIVIGCDGVFDKLSSKDAIHIAWQKVLIEAAKQNVEKVNPQQTHQNCGHCVDGILRTSALRRTVDNVTCVVVAFDGFQKQLQKFITHNQDGTTVDVIEEIQLEPIPEYLSNTKFTQKNQKPGAVPDNSMLLLDDNRNFSESENPLIGGKNLRGSNKNADGKKNTSGAPEKLLSEIAEEDDVSSLSENAQNIQKIGGGFGKVNDDTLGRVAKGSIHSISDPIDDHTALTEREIQRNKLTVEQKRRSQLVPQNSATGQVGNKGSDEPQKTAYGDEKQLDDIEVSIGLPKTSNKN